MFDFVSNHKRIVQVVLALIALPFAFFGVDYYFRSGDARATDVAKVGDQAITLADFDQALREQQDRMRQQLGRNFDPAMFDNAEVRLSILDQLINQQLLLQKAQGERFRVPDTQLQQFIAELPVFQENGRFSPERYRQLLAAQNMSPLMFESRVRQELMLAPLQDPVALGSVVARGSAERYINLLEQQREIALAVVEAEPFVKDVKVEDADVKAFYEANAKAFETPEQVRFEYILLAQDSLVGQVALEPAEVKKQYDENARQYTQGEERKAAHILIAVKPDAKDDEKAAAKKKAEDLLAQLKAAPQRFAELAKANSQDPGSAPQGGDLGSFARGTMVKTFDDAVFAMKPGEIAGPVQSEFGYHVIRLDGVTPAKVRSFDEVKAQIEADLRRQKAAQKFAAAADQLQNLVYEQADSLQGAAKALGVEVKTSPLVTRTQAQAIAQGSAKFVQALFSPESLQSKRNTEAIEVGPNALMAGRIAEHKPAAPRPLAEVADEIRRQLVRKAAGELAQQAGREKLALLEQGRSAKDAGVAFGKAVPLNRNQAQPGISPEALSRIFRLAPESLPKYLGLPNERGGFSILRVERVIPPQPADAAKLAAASTRLGEQLGRELFAADLAVIKAKTDVKINQANVLKK
ncbi:MAG: SurA N-terminal domain-containing protein [Betaproteobacteria bacterium]|nr:SurA N-terminal domain-containing protein [Betaproteobacteria bacterium]MBK7081813.1 SurA N-terminal domain-containing protein [Betaproteobacteria bacterium]MBK7744921.1 SurA N-terminal domain-containing protein [Betaproteobacteria bacterium]MBK8689691.1 SurA N-terminal domain-containing protein [Betaproteobacteria bacterium]MBK9674664.1 SurA N-terminal domain-containing protein [Betaproteobacteria bacterium]